MFVEPRCGILTFFNFVVATSMIDGDIPADMDHVSTSSSFG